MDEIKPLSITDAENVYKPILDLVIKHQGYPSQFKASNAAVRWNGIGKDGGVGLFPLAGAIYLSRYVDGSYRAQFPFQIILRRSPTANKDSMEAQLELENLGKWLEECAIAFKDDRLSLESIKRTSPVFCAAQDQSHTDYGINMQLIYSFDN